MNRVLLLLAITMLVAGACAQEAPEPVPEDSPDVPEEESDPGEVEMMNLTVTSSAFSEGGVIPEKYACDGMDVNPVIRIKDVPAEAETLALIVDDPDAPGGTWVHWVVWNIEPISAISEDSVPGEQGMNDFGKKDYGGPCPPGGTHRYFFKVYVLDTELSLSGQAEKDDLLDAMEGHVLAKGELMGKYTR